MSKFTLDAYICRIIEYKSRALSNRTNTYKKDIKLVDGFYKKTKNYYHMP